MSIDAGAQVTIIYLHIDPVWSLFIIGTGCTLGRTRLTKETLPDFREWCRLPDIHKYSAG